MGWLSRRRGVISIFLLIIFMVTFVFVGALVDAGRYRIAQTYAEAALDSATSSVLSHYNKLIYDLYGIFAVDVDAKDQTAMEEEITKLYKSYVEETLGIAELDTSEYGTILTEVVGKLFDGSESGSEEILHALHVNGLYDFAGTDNIKVGSNVTMADYTYVENQIIEHMKYRAPVSLVQSADGFIGTIKQIGTLTDTIAAVQTKTALIAEYKDLPTSAAEIPNDAADFAKSVQTFLGKYTEAQMLNKASEFDKVFTKATTTYKQALLDADETYRVDLRDGLIEAIETNYEDLIEEVEDLKSDIEDAEFWIEYFEELRDDTEDEDDIEYYNEVIAEYEQDKADWEEELAPKEEIVSPVLNDIKKVENNEYNVAFLESKASRVNRNSNYGYVDVTDLQETRDESKEDAAEDYEDDVKGAAGKASTYFNAMSTEAEGLISTADSILSDLQSNLDKYEEYITKLENLGEEQETISDICTADVQTAKTSAGAIVKMIPYVERMRSCLACFCDGIQGVDSEVDIAEWVEERETSIIEDVQTNFSKNPPKLGTSLSLRTELQNNVAFKNLVAVQKAASAETTEFTGKYKAEEDQADNSTEKKAKKIKNQKMSSQDMEGEIAKEEVTKKDANGEETPIDTLLITENPGLLDINFQKTESSQDETIKTAGEISGTASFDIINALVGALGELIGGVNKLLEDGRDNVYINTYIMDTFPNYFTHYAKAEENKEDKLLSEPYKDYNASLAEVEFIITGAGVGEEEDYASLVEDPEGFAKLIQDIKAFFGVEPEEPVGIGELSAKEFRTRLFGTRLLFNTVSILLDSTMYTQATALSAWAGPFATIVAVVIMIAWVLAETVIDVKVLTASNLWGLDLDADGDGKVPLLKVKSSQWHISVKGALEKITNTAITNVMNELTMGVDQVAESIRGQADALMYDVYNECKTGANKTLDNILNSDAVQGTKDNLLSWGDTFKENVTAVADATNMESVTKAAEDVNSAIDDTMNSAMEYAKNAETETRNTINKYMEDTYTNVSVKVLEQYDKVSDELTSKAKDAINSGGEKMKTLLQENKNKVLPAGVTDGEPEGVFAIQMGYTDYLQFFLFLTNGEVKMKRIMALMQANLTNQKNLEYKTGETDSVDKVLLEYYPASVWADLELDIKYMFMTDQLVPESWKKDGRMKFKVFSAQGY